MYFDKEKTNFSDFGNSFQEKLAHIILNDRKFCDQIREVLDISYFDSKYLRLFVEQIFQYKEEFKTHPSHEIMETILNINYSTKDEEPPPINKQIRNYFNTIKTKLVNQNDEEYVKTRSLDFCKKQVLKKAMIRSNGLLNSSSFDQISKIINDALKLGSDNNYGYDYLLDFEQRFTETSRLIIPTPWDAINNITQGGHGRKELGVVIAPTGCHDENANIIMHDGAVKNVKDIVRGDKVMGIDSKPREVIGVHRGEDVMVKIIPTKGEPFVVNMQHTLSLNKTGTTEKVELTVEEYLKKSKNFKHIYKLYRKGAEFHEKELPLDPYVLGLFLGDGCLLRDQISFTSADPNIVKILMEKVCSLDENLSFKQYRKKNSKAVNYCVRNNGKHNNVLRNVFFKIGLLDKRSGDKFIPIDYKTSSRKQRLELLAGLIDTDGHKNGNCCYEYVSKSEQLAKDVAYLCRSLGFAAYVSEKYVKYCDTIYYRVSISGECGQIPCKLDRKKSGKRKQKRNVLSTGFECEILGNGEYYGIALDETAPDQCYLLEDFTVMKNCGKSMLLSAIGADAIKNGYNVVYYTLELQDTVIAQRFDSCISGIDLNELLDHKEAIREIVTNDNFGKLIIKEYPSQFASIQTIRNHLERLRVNDFIPDLIIVDYGDLLRPEKQTSEIRHGLGSIYEGLRGLAQMYNCAVWTASQTNRSGLNAPIVTMEAISEAFNKCFVADLILCLSRTMHDKNNLSGRIFVPKNRNGIDGIVMPIEMRTANVHIKVFPPTEETIEEIIKKATSDNREETDRKLTEVYKKYKNQST